MKKQIHSKLNLIGLALFISLVIHSCYEPVEGCLNPLASNYDVFADKACDGCCTFPKLVLLFRHSHDISVNPMRITLPDTLDDDFANTFFLNAFNFFIQDIVLSGDNGTLELLDSIELIQDGIPSFVKNDITLINPSQSRYEVGSFNRFDAYNTLSFQVGLNISNLDFTNLGAQNVLLENRDEFYLNERFASFGITLVRDTMDKDTTQYLLFDRLYKVSLEGEFSTELDTDLQIPVEIDYKKWLEGVDMINDSETELLNKMSDNTSNVFGL